MKTKYIINLILLGLVFGLYWFNNQDSNPINDMKQLTTVVSSDIKTISIARADTQEIVLEKSESIWEITQPIKAPANSSRIDLLLSFLHTASYAQSDDISDASLSQFGLAPANISLRLDNQIIQFGSVEPISKHRYVLSNNIVHLITDRITPLLSANAASFIENKLIPQQNIITKLSLPILNTDKSLSINSLIIENNAGHWQSNLPNITTDQLSTYIESWQHAYAIQVLAKKIESHFETVNNKVQIWYQNESSPIELELQISNKALFIIDQRQQLRYQFPLAILPELLPIQPISP